MQGETSHRDGNPSDRLLISPRCYLAARFGCGQRVIGVAAIVGTDSDSDADAGARRHRGLEVVLRAHLCGNLNGITEGFGWIWAAETGSGLL